MLIIAKELNAQKIEIIDEITKNLLGVEHSEICLASEMVV